jgi:hypothetical protein
LRTGMKVRIGAIWREAREDPKDTARVKSLC